MDSKASERLAISKCQRSRAVLEVWQDTFVAKASAGCESTQGFAPDSREERQRSTGGTGVTLLPIQCAKFLEFHVECSHSILTAEVTEKP